MKILAVSDIVVEFIYNPKIRQLLPDLDLVIGCGDLPEYYLEFIVSALDIPLVFVHGNHSQEEILENSNRKNFHGAIDLHCKVKRIDGYSFAGVEGSIRYNDGKFQYSQFEMWLNVFRLVPSLIKNRITSGRQLNVFISHASPWGIHDQPDYAHQGVKAFRWLLDRFHPDYHLHGHIHVYRPDMSTETQYGRTKVVNAYGYRKIEL
jgi:Icc-related predicted phosphoesterase